MKKKYRIWKGLLAWFLLAVLLVGGYFCICAQKYYKSAEDTLTLLQEAMETMTFPDESRGMAGAVTDEQGVLITYAESHLNLPLADLSALFKRIAVESPKDTAKSGTVFLTGTKYRYLCEPDHSGFRIAAAECRAEEKMIFRMQRGGCFAATGALLLLPVMLLIFLRKPERKAPENEN